jgi:hypothetical protein
MLSPDEFWQRQTALDQQVRESFPRWLTYGLSDWGGTAMLGEWPLGDGTFRSIRYDDGPDTTVVVASAEGDIDQAVEHLLMNLPGPREPGSGAPVAEPENRQRTLADAVAIAVPGAAIEFAGWHSGGFTVVGAAVGAVEIAVCWRGVDAALLSIDLVSDVEPYLDGRREVIRAARRKYGIEE